jgi:hypothetical protein
MTSTIVLYIYLSFLCNSLLRVIYLIRDEKISAACIIGIQFQHLNYGDRLFYTHQSEFTLGMDTLYLLIRIYILFII